jgi:hypothetical protein
MGILAHVHVAPLAPGRGRNLRPQFDPEGMPACRRTRKYCAFLRDTLPAGDSHPTPRTARHYSLIVMRCLALAMLNVKEITSGAGELNRLSWMGGVGC